MLSAPSLLPALSKEDAPEAMLYSQWWVSGRRKKKRERARVRAYVCVRARRGGLVVVYQHGRMPSSRDSSSVVRINDRYRLLHQPV